MFDTETTSAQTHLNQYSIS